MNIYKVTFGPMISYEYLFQKVYYIMQPCFLFSSSIFSWSLFLRGSALSEIRLRSIQEEFVELILWFFI